MKKIYLILSLAALCAACSRETLVPEAPEEGLVEYTFSAGAPESKTTFNGTDFVWTPSDRISVFDGVLKNRRFETEDSTVRATFRGRAKESSSFYAFYPYASTLSMEEAGKLTTAIPSTQTVTPGTISDGYNLSMGRILSDNPSGVSGSTFIMKNVGGYIKVVLGASSNPINYMSIRSAAGESISGGIAVDYTGDVPVATPDNGMPVIGLVPADSTFNAGTYYVVATPTTLARGLKLSLVREDDYSIEVPFTQCSSIVRNSAKSSTLEIPDPDKLEWSEPLSDTLKVNFIDFESATLKYSQPFDEELPALSSASSDLSEGAYHLKGSGEEFYISTTRLNLNSGQGLRLELGGYITLPAIPGKRLSKVTLNYGSSSTTTPNYIKITTDEDDAEAVPGGEMQTLGPNAQGTDYVWTLSESVANTKYRIVTTQMYGNMRVRSLELIYIGRDVASVSSATITNAVLGENEITVTGGLKVVHPESGIITWGVEYREAHEEEWTEGPTGNGTEISATIPGIDNTKTWYVRIYGCADAGENIYSSQMRLRITTPELFVIDKFSSKEYDGTSAGGYWKFIGDRTGYVYPNNKTSGKNRYGLADSYAYYASQTDTEPVLSDVTLCGTTSNGYYLSGTEILHYRGYVSFPAKDGYFISKVIITVSASAAGDSKKIVVCEADAKSQTDKVLGESAGYSTASASEDLSASVVAPDNAGVKVFITTAFHVYKLQVAYTPL